MDFWSFRISWSATVPGRNRLRGFFIPGFIPRAPPVFLCPPFPPFPFVLSACFFSATSFSACASACAFPCVFACASASAFPCAFFQSADGVSLHHTRWWRFAPSSLGPMSLFVNAL